MRGTYEEMERGTYVESLRGSYDEMFTSPLRRNISLTTLREIGKEICVTTNDKLRNHFPH